MDKQDTLTAAVRLTRQIALNASLPTGLRRLLQTALQELSRARRDVRANAKAFALDW